METAAYSEVRKLLAQIRAVTSNPVVEQASDQIEVLCRAYMTPSRDFLPDIQFSPAERRMLDLLKARLGKTVSKDRLMDAIDSLSDDHRNPKVIDVLICRMRAKFEANKASFHIQTDRGEGYRLCEGQTKPWSGPKSSPLKYAMGHHPKQTHEARA
jgi:DNA-binding response OmpR family regulator